MGFDSVWIKLPDTCVVQIVDSFELKDVYVYKYFLYYTTQRGAISANEDCQIINFIFLPPDKMTNYAVDSYSANKFYTDRNEIVQSKIFWSFFTRNIVRKEYRDDLLFLNHLYEQALNPNHKLGQIYFEPFLDFLANLSRKKDKGERPVQNELNALKFVIDRSYSLDSSFRATLIGFGK